jgi:hypothetical protein
MSSTIGEHTNVDDKAAISDVIAAWAKDMKVDGKVGKRLLQPSLAVALRSAGYAADEEDQAQVLKPGMAVWRSKDDNSVVPTRGRRRVDIVAYKDAQLVALIETETDLNDLRESGVTRRNGHYDVFSISRNAAGNHFHSYNSLERMAAAAFYWHALQTTGHYPSPDNGTRSLEVLRSDRPADHNPGRCALFLVSGSCRAQDKGILQPRLESLGATLVCISDA